MHLIYNFIRAASLTFTLLLSITSVLSQAPDAEEWHTFTEAVSERTVVAKIVEKKPDNSKVRIALQEGGAMWVDVTRFSKADIDYIKAWELLDLKLRANTVATASSRTSWAETWGKFDANGAEIISGGVSSEFKSRIVGVELENRGSVEEFVMEFFWLGFPLNEKNSRVITSMATRQIKAPAGERINIRVGSTYRYVETSLLYLKSDRSLYDWSGFYVRTWSGYGYAGWAVRISDGKGNPVDQSAAQPSFLHYIQKIPLPILKTK